MHVFIDSGLKSLLATHQRLQVFEMGFGTGLNALLTLLYAEKEKTFTVKVLGEVESTITWNTAAALGSINANFISIHYHSNL